MGQKVFSQPPIVQVLPLKKMREACNFHHRYTSTMTDNMRKKFPENHIVGFFIWLAQGVTRVVCVVFVLSRFFCMFMGFQSRCLYLSMVA